MYNKIIIHSYKVLCVIAVILSLRVHLYKTQSK